MSTAKGVFQGWFQVLDFAGGTVVHINAGVAGLVSCLLLGKRKEPGPGHNMVLTFIGTGLLWVGWFGFNAGSAVTAGLQAGMAMTVTQIATAVAALTWMFVEWGHRGKPTVIGICSGAVAGLVAITPASGFVGPVGALVIGIACGIGCYWGATGLKHTFGYDDALDAFGVHAVGGIIGALLTGVFAVNEFSGHSGLLEGDVGQFINQIKGVATVIVYDVIVTFIILKIVDVADRAARHRRGGTRRPRSRPSRRSRSLKLSARRHSIAAGSSFLPEDLGRPSGRPFLFVSLPFLRVSRGRCPLRLGPPWSLPYCSQ